MLILARIWHRLNGLKLRPVQFLRRPLVDDQRFQEVLPIKRLGNPAIAPMGLLMCRLTGLYRIVSNEESGR